jgi:hypothetical protein
MFKKKSPLAPLYKRGGEMMRGKGSSNFPLLKGGLRGI